MAYKIKIVCYVVYRIGNFQQGLEIKLLKLDQWIKTTIVCPFMLKDTNMFKKANIKFPLLTPPITCHEVVNKIIDAA